MTWAHVKSAYKAAEGLDVHARTVLLDLAKLADGKGLSYPTLDYLSRHPGLKTSRVKQAIDTLVELGLVSKSAAQRQRGQRWAPNAYTVNLSEKAVTVATTRLRKASHRSRDVAAVPWPRGGYKLEDNYTGPAKGHHFGRREGDERPVETTLPEPANDGPTLKLIPGGRVA